MPLMWIKGTPFKAPKPVDEVTPDEFFDLCERFDWFYDWSDDHSIWKTWNKRHRFLREVIAYHKRRMSVEPYQAIYQAFERHHYSGEPWGTEKNAVPKRDNFTTTFDRKEES